MEGVAKNREFTDGDFEIESNRFFEGHHLRISKNCYPLLPPLPPSRPATAKPVEMKAKSQLWTQTHRTLQLTSAQTINYMLPNTAAAHNIYKEATPCL
jgi:hypothetical protein